MWRDFAVSLRNNKASWLGIGIIFLNLADAFFTIYILESFSASGSWEVNPFAAALLTRPYLFLTVKLVIPLLFVVYFESQRSRYPQKTKIIYGIIFAIYSLLVLYQLAGIYVLHALKNTPA